MSKSSLLLRILAVATILIIAGVGLHLLLKSMDRESIPAVILGFFAIAFAIVVVAVFSKAYSNWRD